MRADKVLQASSTVSATRPSPVAIPPSFKKGSSSATRGPFSLCLSRLQTPPLLGNTPSCVTTLSAGLSWVCSGSKLQFLKSWSLIQEQVNTKQVGNLREAYYFFFSEGLPISQLLPQDNTINTSVMRALIHTWISYSLCASSYNPWPPHPRLLTCMEQKTDPGKLFLISVPWLMQKLREIIVFAILLGKSLYELGLTKWVKIPNVQLL